MKADSTESWLRWVTPVLIVLIGFLGNLTISDVKSSLKELNLHFTNHLHEHKDIEVVLEKRLTRLEAKLDGCIK